MPEKILGRIGNVLKQNGVAAGNVTKEMLEEMMTNLFNAGRQSVQDSTKSSPNISQQHENYPLYVWSDGKFHKLSENFVFPNLSIGTCWHLWVNENINERIPPYSALEVLDVPSKSQGRFSDIKCLMKRIQNSLANEINIQTLRARPNIDQQAYLKHAVIRIISKSDLEDIPFDRIVTWQVTTAIKEFRAIEPE